MQEDLLNLLRAGLRLELEQHHVENRRRNSFLVVEKTRDLHLTRRTFAIKNYGVTDACPDSLFAHLGVLYLAEQMDY
jgi:hypothetical protein